MKRRSICNLMLLAIFTLLFAIGKPIVANGSNSFGLHMYTEEISASSKVLMFHQSGSQQESWQSKKLNGTKDGKQVYMGSNSPTKLGWGCGIYSLAHAIQWAGGCKMTSSNGGSFLDEFIKMDGRPWEYSYVEKAYEKIISKYNCKWSKYTLTTETALRDFFAQGGVIRSNIPGHFQVAVGIAEGKNGETWVHILDSTCYSTISRLNKKGYDAYDFSNGTKLGKDIYRAGEFWIGFDAFKNAFCKLAAITPKNPRLGKPDSIELNTYNYSLNLSDTLALTVTAYPATASNTVTWTSSDTSIATVSNTGIVTALKAGKTVIITATSTVDSTKKASCQVTTYYQGTDTLKFSGVKYPHTYNKNKTISWAGKVESDVALSSVVINLYVGTSKYTQSGNISSGSKSFSMSSFGDTVFKKLSSGNFTFELIATDSVGRRIAFSNDGCKVSTSGDHVMYDAPGSYSRPTLLGFGERNGHRYEVYENTGRNWDSDKEHAIELGGHLATISDTAENEFICNLVVSSGGTYGFVGGYYDSGWHWVDGSPFTYNPWNSSVPADGSFGYSAVVGLASANSKTWAKSLKSGMMNYVVEYDPIPVSAIVLEGENIMTYGDSGQTLTTTVLPANAYNKTVRYSSSNPTYATVDAITGHVTVINDGDAEVIIYAIAQDGSEVLGEFPLFIRHKPIPVTSLSVQADYDLYIDDKTITLITGQTAELEEVFTPNNADESVYFWSTNDYIATFEPYSNVVIANTPGTCRLNCSTPDNLFTDYLDLIVLPVSGTWGNLTWSLNENGILTISGSGDMDDFGYNNNSDAWRPYAAAIKEVFIESGITSIGDYAFGNSNLRSITIPQGIQSIGYTAFYGCGSLTSITIPQSVTNIGAWAFGQCKALREIEIPNKITEISEYTFFGCDNISHITLPPSVTSISNNAFGYCFALTGFEIPSKVKTIGDSAFEYCNKLSVVKIPASVIDIGNNAFIGSANITLYGYGNSTAHEYANNNGISFYLLDYLFTTPDFTVPENLRTIEPEAFSGINAKSIKLCDNVVTIGSKAFSNCEKLLQILIPSSCTSIANDAFENIEELIIYGNFGSYAETYAHDHGITFEVPGSISEQIRQYVLGYLPDYYSYNLDLNKDGIVDTKDYSLAKMSGL